MRFPWRPSPQQPSRNRWFVVLLLLIVGCGDEPPPFTEVKRPDQVITDSEWAAFERVVSALESPRLPSPQPAFPVPPNWPANRTLPIADLMEEEKLKLENGWSVERWSSLYTQNRLLARLLRREQMTVDQFSGMVLTLGLAAARKQLDPALNLTASLENGRPLVNRLRKDQRVFSSLPSVERFDILREAHWLTRIDRIEHLQMPPEGNLQLVEKHWDWLKKILPIEFLEDGAPQLIDRMAAEGIPFLETERTGLDAHIEWSPAEAIRLPASKKKPDAPLAPAQL